MTSENWLEFLGSHPITSKLSLDSPLDISDILPNQTPESLTLNSLDLNTPSNEPILENLVAIHNTTLIICLSDSLGSLGSSRKSIRIMNLTDWKKKASKVETESASLYEQATYKVVM